MLHIISLCFSFVRVGGVLCTSVIYYVFLNRLEDTMKAPPSTVSLPHVRRSEVGEVEKREGRGK